MKKINRAGEIIKNNQGCFMKILDYFLYDNITIEFQDKYKYTVLNSTYHNFKRGTVKNPYFPTVNGVGYIGLTKVVDNFGKVKKSYIHWNGMLERCYKESFKEKRQTYKECLVCDEWLCYENFEKWYDENYWECGNEVMCLDKDILIKGNKIYSPGTSLFVPQRINTLFIFKKSCRGKYPVGVHKNNKTYSARILNKDGTRIAMGGKDNPIDAFYVYKKERENTIKQIAEDYKKKYINFPIVLYEAMYRWEVEISD